MDRSVRLTGKFVEQVKEPGRYGEGRGGNGLSLRVRASRSGVGVSKTWEQRIHVNGRATTLGLGTYPAVKLAEARIEAAENAQRIRAAFPRVKGIDRLLGMAGPGSPGGAVAVTAIEAPPFRELATEWIETQRPGWKPGSKTEGQLTSLLDTYILPVMGDTPVDAVTPKQVYAVLSPIWQTRAPTAKKVKTLLAGIFRVAVTKGYRDDDPMTRGCLALGKQRHATDHHDALPYEQAGEAVTFIRGADAYAAKRQALEFIILTATRTGEVRKMRARELDLPNRTWTVPAAHMKGGREHRVPLSDAAMSVLFEARAFSGQPDDLVFKSKAGGMLGDDVMRQLLVRKYPGVTTHGFRSSFRDWAADQTDYPAEVAEHALAHLEGSATVRSYLTTDMFNKRRRLMRDWAAYIARG